VEWDGPPTCPPSTKTRRCRPRSWCALRDLVAGADALLIATPEYNASVPGALKNALDWASRPFPANVLRDKAWAVIGASTGPFGAVWAQAEVRKTPTAGGAHVLGSGLTVGTDHTAFNATTRSPTRNSARAWATC
jgi:chromate reductase